MSDQHASSCNHDHAAEEAPAIEQESPEVDASRRNFVWGTLAAGGAAVSAATMSIPYVSTAQAQGLDPVKSGVRNHYYLAATDKTVHWGYFSKKLKPVVTIDSGDFVTIEAITHHSYDDYERLIKGDPGVESIFYWDKKKKNVNRRGAGPMDASIKGRGAGEGFGVHVCTGPVFVKGAELGDILEVRIVDVSHRPCANPAYKGKTFGINAAAWWGFHYNDLIEEPKKREVITVYEVDTANDRSWAKAVYNYKWEPQTDPFGVVHSIIDYPGVPVDHSLVKENHGILKDVRIPVRPHFGVVGLAPKEADMVDSIPPGPFGGNIDNWRIGKGATMYYPVQVSGALFSVGDPHASQGDSELCGTPLLETKDDWLIHGYSYANYLEELGANAQSEIYSKSSVDLALRDAFRKVRHFLMTTQGLTEDEAISLITVGVDFGITQVVDGNWGVHAIVKKALFAGR